MKKVVYIILLAVMASGFAGCKKFLDVNKNPNDPTDESITPNLILSSSLHRMGSQMAISYAATGRWMGYWARSGTYGPNPDEEAYRITSTYESNEWSTWFDILNDLDVMEAKATELGEDFYTAAAKVLKTVGFMYLVDQYNNVPYTEAFDLNNQMFPKYDKGQDIYNDLFVQLDEALSLFQGVTEISSENEQFDIMFGGDVTNWIEFVNTQRLKLALRLVNVTGFDAAGQMAKITNEGFLKVTAYVQPGYTKDLNKQNPFWNSFKDLYDGSVADNFNRLNNYVKGKFQNNGDQARLERFFSPNGRSGTNYTGFNYGEVISNAPSASASADVAGPALAKGPDQAQWFFTSVESKFLQSEAIARGWLTGNAELSFRDAVTESFTWLGLTAAQATTYLDQTGVDIVEWPATAAEQIITIGMQKYLALTGVNNFEAWVDYRRIGVPTDLPLSLHPSRGNNIIPLRLQYPQSEFSFNQNSVSAEGTIDPQSSRIFWDVN
ncbi:SusD/RagB family nutrient-binding outer membrane lipoprotein [Niabella insulamsoli]|uniref:SusD/RagB family nutrient-binding outer membrane lipoprotein n=1 Tax=Niabella insulamsoli TaxID=3144874 RepID=UPI0031FE0249